MPKSKSGHSDLTAVYFSISQIAFFGLLNNGELSGLFIEKVERNANFRYAKRQ